MGRYIGLDTGYGFVKVMDGREGFILPSVVGDGSTESSERFGTRHPDPVDDIRLTLAGSTYYVGSLAVRRSGMAHRGLTDTRDEGNVLRILALAGLSLFCQQPVNSFSIVTGLPPGRMHLRDRVLATLKGQHVIGRPGRAGSEELVINISDLEVVPQPLGTYWSQVLNNRGHINESNPLLEGSVGILDIGYRTTDLVTIQTGEYAPEVSRTIPIGFSKAYIQVANAIAALHRVEREPHTLDESMMSGVISLAGAAVDISPLVREAYESLATKLLVELRAFWEVTDYDTVLLTGGGGQALSPYLLPQIRQGRLIENAPTANSLGYYYWAQRTFSG